MVEIADIGDEGSLEAWLNGHSHDASVWIASRAAARVLPAFWVWTFPDRASEGDLSVLPILRCLVISEVAAVRPTADIRIAAVDADAAFVAARVAGAARAAARAAAIAAARAAHVAAAFAASDDYANAANGAFIAASVAAADDYEHDGEAALNATQMDCALFLKGALSDGPALWPAPVDWHHRLWSEVRRTATEPEWAFWIRWYQDALDGKRPDWDLLEAIALIDSGIWDAGPKAVAAEIARLQDKHLTDPVNLDAQLRQFPRAKPEVVERVRGAMERNRQELPPTFDAIESLILLEIERLQTKNYTDDDNRDESIRQIGVYLTLHAAVTELRAQIPKEGKIEALQAEKSERLLTLYRNEFAKLPREKVGEVVEGAWETSKGLLQFGLIAGSTYLGMLYGLPPMAGISIGALCFAPKKAGDIIKHAKDALPKPAG